MGHPVDNVCVQKEPFVSSRNSMEAPRVGARPPPPPRPLQRPNRRRRSHRRRTGASSIAVRNKIFRVTIGYSDGFF